MPIIISRDIKFIRGRVEEVCCDELKEFIDYSNSDSGNPFIDFKTGGKLSGGFGRYSKPIKYCPFCAEEIVVTYNENR